MAKFRLCVSSQISFRLWFYLTLLVCVCAMNSICNLNKPNTSSCPCARKSNTYISEEDCTIYRTDITTPYGCVPKSEHVEYVSSRNLPVNITVVAIRTSINGNNHMGLNVSVTVNDKRVNGFSLKPVNHGFLIKANICRYFDFRKAQSSIVGTTFYNDDFYFPQNITGNVTYLDVGVFLKDGSSIWSRLFLTPIYPITIDNLSSICKWNSLVVVDTVANGDNSIDVSFTQAPAGFNVSSYLVQALSAETADDKTVVWGSHVSANYNSSVGRAVVHGLSRCNGYKLRVKCIDADGCCNYSTTARFTQACQDDGIVLTTCITVGMLTLLTIGVAVYCIRKYQKRAVSFSNVVPRKVFLAYSYDVAGHAEVVERFALFLRSCCNCTVMLDKWDIQNQDPSVWVRRSILNCDYVVIIWSRGACLHMDREKPRILLNQPGYLAEFGCTITAILSEFLPCLRTRFYHRNLSKFVNITFDYTLPSAKCDSSVKVPFPFTTVDDLRLPDNLDRLVCHLHCTTPSSFDLVTMTGGCRCWPWWPISHTHPPISAENLGDTPEGQNLREAIDAMRRYERDTVGWFEALVVDAPKELLAAFDPRPSISSDDEVRISGCETGETDVGEDDDDDERYCSSSQLSSFPPNINELPIYGGNSANVRYPCFPPPSSRRSSDDSLPSLPSEVFQFGIENEGGVIAR